MSLFPTTEYRQEIPSDSTEYLKTISAFANTDGGEMIFSIDKADLPMLVDKLADSIYNEIEPKIIPYIYVQRIEGKSVIIVRIAHGQQPPYYIRSLGILDGTYIRAAGTTRLAASYQIQEFILSSKNTSYDRMRTNRELSREELNEFCTRLENHAKKLQGMDKVRKLSVSNLIAFSLVKEEDGRYFATNGYQLLEGKPGLYPNAETQCALFKGKDAGIFIDRKDISGAIDEQVEDAVAFVLQHISLWSRTEGLTRKDFYELPISSIKEVITNAICHRSYQAEGKIQIAIYDDRITVTSPGSLPRGLTIDMLKEERSMAPNPAIAKAFWYMGLIEEWGLDVPRIIKESREYGLKEPSFEDLDGRFRVTLYRRKPSYDDAGVIYPSLNEDAPSYGSPSIEDKLLSLLEDNPNATQPELASATNTSIITIKRAMKKLQEQGRLNRQGNNRKVCWKVIK